MTVHGDSALSRIRPMLPCVVCMLTLTSWSRGVDAVGARRVTGFAAAECRGCTCRTPFSGSGWTGRPASRRATAATPIPTRPRTLSVASSSPAGERRRRRRRRHHEHDTEHRTGDRHLLTLACSPGAAFELALELSFGCFAALLVARHCGRPPVSVCLAVGPEYSSWSVRTTPGTRPPESAIRT